MKRLRLRNTGKIHWVSGLDDDSFRRTACGRIFGAWELEPTKEPVTCRSCWVAQLGLK